MQQIDTNKIDWHLVLAAASIILTLGSIILGCYVSVIRELNTIKTVLIVKGIMPKEMAATNNEGKKQ